MTNTEQERAEFEAWLGIKPCGAAHDLAWSAWKAARRAPVVPDMPTKTMLKAAQKADCDHSPFNEWLQDNGRDFIAMYRAAISAAPAPNTSAEALKGL